MTEPVRDLLLCAGDFLEQGRIVDGLSRLLTGAALVVVAIGPGAADAVAIPAVAAGLVETYLAVRVGFDAALFRRMGGAPQTADFAGTDAALTRLGFPPAGRHGRPASARIGGARRLFRFQVLALTLQVLLLLSAAAARRLS